VSAAVDADDAGDDDDDGGDATDDADDDAASVFDDDDGCGGGMRGRWMVAMVVQSRQRRGRHGVDERNMESWKVWRPTKETIGTRLASGGSRR